MRKINTLAKRFIVPMAILLMAGGCGGEKELPKPDLHPVHGRVTWKGEPVSFATVTFHPLGSTTKSEPSGYTGADGTFAVRTLSNSGEPDGAFAGEYQITIEQHDPETCPILPQGGKPTKIEGLLKPVDTIKIESGDNEVNIEVPGS